MIPIQGLSFIGQLSPEYKIQFHQRNTKHYHNWYTFYMKTIQNRPIHHIKLYFQSYDVIGIVIHSFTYADIDMLQITVIWLIVLPSHLPSI